MRSLIHVFWVIIFSTPAYLFLENSELYLHWEMDIRNLGPSVQGQVFWAPRRDEIFSEQASLRVPLVLGDHHYEARIPREAVRLRLDPVEGPGVFVIKSLSVRNILGVPLATGSLENPADLMLANHLRRVGESFESEGDDPILGLEFWNADRIHRSWMINILIATAWGILMHLAYFFSVFRLARTSRARLGTTTVIVSLLLGFAISEVAFRWHIGRKYSADVKQAHPYWEVFAGSDRAFQWSTSWWKSVRTANLKESGTFSFRLNDRGFRGQEWDLQADSRSKILVLGDSYTFGWGVSDVETYPHYLQEMLDRRKKRYQVLNAGIPGYGISEELALFQELSQEFKPAVVVLGIVMNDAQPPGNVPTLPQTTYRFAFSWLFSEVHERLRAGFPALPIGRGTKFIPRANYNLDFSHPVNAAVYRDALAGIAQLSRAIGSDCIAFVLPDFTQAFGASYSYHPAHKSIRKIAAEVGIEVRDIWDQVRTMDSKVLQVPGDGHPNGKAQLIIAKYIFESLNQRGISSQKPL